MVALLIRGTLHKQLRSQKIRTKKKEEGTHMQKKRNTLHVRCPFRSCIEIACMKIARMVDMSLKATEAVSLHRNERSAGSDERAAKPK